MSRKYILFFSVFLACLLADQVSKWWIIQNVSLTDEIQVIPGFLSIVHAKNPGAAFSFMADNEHRFVVFAVSGIISIVVLGAMLYQLKEEDKVANVALALIMSCAIGNNIDRLRFGEVTDFVRNYTDNPTLAPWLIEKFGTATWPIWNVADACLVVGVTLFIIYSLFLESGKEEALTEEESAVLLEDAS